jgi:hypothetical protein
VVPGLQAYNYRNKTDCQKPETVRELVKPLRLSGWEKEDVLDALFEGSGRCRISFSQLLPSGCHLASPNVMGPLLSSVIASCTSVLLYSPDAAALQLSLNLLHLHTLA